MDDDEANYVINAVHFLAREGSLFLNLYDFDLGTGTWKHKYSTSELPQFSLDEALGADESEPAILSLALRRQLYTHYLTEAKRIADRLGEAPVTEYASLEGELGDLQFFALRADDRYRRH